VVTIKREATIREAADKLADGARHSLPVVDEEGRLLGIVTSTDLIEHLLRLLPSG
jgi:CBS domain-containing protein